MFDLFLRRVERIHQHSVIEVLVAYASGYSPNANKLAKRLTSEFERNLCPDEVVIVVAQTQLSATEQNFLKSRDLLRLTQNFPKVKYLLCSFSEEGSIVSSKIFSCKGKKLEFGKRRANATFPLKRLARQIITEQYKEREPSESEGGRFHYIKPSGRHSDIFLRASRLFSNSSESSFYSLLCLQRLADVAKNRAFIPSQIIIDSPVIYPLAQGIADLLRLTLGELASPIQIDSFGSFDGLSLGDPELRELPLETLVLISASTSGGLVKELKKTTKLESNHFLHFLYLGESKAKKRDCHIVCDLAYDKDVNPLGFLSRPKNYADGKCSFCARKSFPIKLKGDYFAPVPPKAVPVTILRTDAPKAIHKYHDQAKRVFGQNIFTIGSSDKARGVSYRHFHVDEDALIKAPEVKKRLKYFVDLYFPHDPQEIIYIDEGSKKLAKEINGLTNRKIKLIGHNSLLNKVKATKAVVVCAAVIESGRTLQEVSRDLRNIASTVPIVYFILLAKSLSESKLRTLEKSLAMTANADLHKVVIIEKLSLPTSVGDHGWQLELQFIQDHELTAESYWNSRYKKVSALDRVIKAPVFLTNKDNKPLQVQEGFVFFPNDTKLIEDSSEADVYFCVASVLQNLRMQGTNKSSSLQSTIYSQGLLSAENFTRYNDGILHACFLRAALVPELDFTDHVAESREMARIIKRILCASHLPRGEAAMEFLFALGSEKIKLLPTDLNEILALDVKLIKEVRVSKFFKRVKGILKKKKMPKIG